MMQDETSASLRAEAAAYVKKKYHSKPEYPWRRYPDYMVFRHEDNNKCYIFMAGVAKNKLGLEGKEIVDILNIKLDDLMLRDLLLRQPGYFPGYHMGRGTWVSVLLDGTVPFEEICDLIDTSYKVTASKKKKQQIRPPKEWVVPANPKYYDIVHAFDSEDEIVWKQGSGIRKGDTVFMYVAAPVSAILYQCLVTEMDIPCNFEKKEITIKALMKIRLQRRYEQDRFTFERLKEEYGIFAVRGPRGIPNSLSAALRK